MKRPQTLLFLFSLIIVLGGYTISNLTIKESRKELGAKYSLQITPIPAGVIKLIGGEFCGLLANYTLLKITSFTSTKKGPLSEDEWNNINQGFKQVYELDPFFMQNYLMAQSIVAFDAKKPVDAIGFLTISGGKRFWDYKPGFYTGFDYYYFLNDYEKASRVFLETAKVKNAPLLISLLGSRFALKNKQTETGIHILVQMLDNPDVDDSSKAEIKKRVVALKGVLLLEKAIEKYRTLYNNYPKSLDLLITTKIIDNLPYNPYNLPFLYNSTTNEIFFDEVNYE